MSNEPTIFEPEDHPITLDMIDDDALFIMRKLNKAGFSGYLVGGGVRDLYLGKLPKDFDISTDAKPGQIRRLFSNSRTIGRRFRLVQVFFKHHKVFEVSTLRSLSEHDLDGPEAVLAPNNTYGTLDEDAQRRDLSINALFYEIEKQQIIDYVGGVRDLEGCIVRILGEPERRIKRDPVRMMRVIRHCARNNFTIEATTWQAVCQNSGALTLCPPSRLRDELFKDIYSGVSYNWFELAEKSGIFPRLFSLYDGIMSHELPGGKNCYTQLQRTFKTIDRLNNAAVDTGGHRQPDYFLLALILVPWAYCSFDMDDGRSKGGNKHYHRAKHIRDALNETIGPALNLRRSTRQEITTLLANLPLMVRCQENNQWPKYLKRKSYYHACRLFQLYYREADSGVQVPDSQTLKKPESQHDRTPPQRTRKASRRKGRPAFSNSRKGGVFGFKR